MLGALLPIPVILLCIPPLVAALERGGSYTSEEVMANVRARLAARGRPAE